MDIFTPTHCNPSYEMGINQKLYSLFDTLAEAPSVVVKSMTAVCSLECAVSPGWCEEVDVRKDGTQTAAEITGQSYQHRLLQSPGARRTQVIFRSSMASGGEKNN